MQWIRPKRHAQKDAQAPPPPPPPAPGSDGQSVPAPAAAPADGDVEAATPAPQEKAPSSRSSPIRWMFIFSRRGQQPTLRQWLYIYVNHGLGAMIFTGFLNFGLAFLTYGRKKHPVLLWGSPGSVAGDTFITIILQCIIAWVLQMFIVRRDLRKGAARPLAWQPKHTPNFDRWLYMLREDTAAARVLDRRGGGPDPDTQQNENESDEEKHKQKEQQKQARLLGQRLIDVLACVGALLVRSVLLALPALVLFMPASLAILVAAAGVPVRGGGRRDYLFPSAMAPIIFKGVLGAAQALFISPEYAVFWMTRQGYAAAPAAPAAPAADPDSA
ncbi:hypothetical protein MAPG_05787 [Magnaporthiopsis poae ATCC 64411]|uniref:Uncharacterized protein n=1 Tax=Magnaporthiopsis poae (strain ATCC 64411 / 73-15) TaxID=644358 RepID=A0A0C4E0B7_MAGP6|nr:hypothetical protein MAPG_05787 [Magnaporthiopsis poae ATCC 64411]